MAAGIFMEFINRLLRASAHTLLLELVADGVQGDDRANILRDFEAFRRHLQFIFLVTFGHWEQSPWLFFGIGHHALDIARRCAATALRLFVAMPVGHVHHFLTILLCTPGSQGYTDMADFCAGVDPSGLPLLTRMRARFRFAPTSERWAEALHPTNRHWLVGAHHTSPVRAAQNSLLPTARAQLRRDPYPLLALARHCAFARNGRLALGAVGLLQHPSVYGAPPAVAGA